MRIWFYLLATIAAIGLMSRRSRDAQQTDGEVAAILLEGQLVQAESMFAFDIIERAADRTSDDLRAIDVNVNGLLAVQAAIYAILIDQIDDLPWPLRFAFITAIVLAASNLLLGRGKSVPDPQTFREAHIANTDDAREDATEVLLRRARANDRLFVLKRRLFSIALGLTVAASLAVPVLQRHAPLAAPSRPVVQSTQR